MSVAATAAYDSAIDGDSDKANPLLCVQGIGVWCVEQELEEVPGRLGEL